MKPLTPSPSRIYQSIQSFFNTLVGNVSFGSPTAWDGNGVGTTYPQDNCTGVLIRVGSNVNPYSLPNFWGGANVATVITHNLGRAPIGYFVASKDVTCDVYNPAPFVSTANTITLLCTTGAADVLLYIF